MSIEKLEPRGLFSRRTQEELISRINALSNLRINANVGSTVVNGVLRSDGTRSQLDLDLSNVTIAGYAPANADTLAQLDTDDDGTLLFDGQRVGASGLTQSNVTWASSVVVSLTSDRVRRLDVAGNTSITITDLAQAREVYLLIFGGGTDYTLTWQTGVNWLTPGGTAPGVIPAGKLMSVHMYSSGSAASDLVAAYNTNF